MKQMQRQKQSTTSSKLLENRCDDGKEGEGKDLLFVGHLATVKRILKDTTKKWNWNWNLNDDAGNGDDGNTANCNTIGSIDHPILID